MKKSYYYSLPCIHNAGTQYTSGRQCSDCGNFVPNNTLEGFVTHNSMTIGMALWNRKASFHRGETKEAPSAELIELCDNLMTYDYLKSLSKEEAQLFMEKTYNFLKENNIGAEEATIELK